MKLTCDLCGGQLQMNADGKNAVYVECGLIYSVEQLRKRMGVQNEKTDSGSAAFGETPIKETPIGVTSGVGGPVMRELVIERKFSIAGSAYGAVIIVDGVECAMLGPKGTVSIPVSEGEHDVWVVVTYNGKVSATLDKIHFRVGANNWYGQFKLKRTAWNALWLLDIIEGEENNFQ